MLIIENTAVSITGCLISALIEKKIKVVFCDEKRNPNAELMPCYGSHDCSRKIKAQVNWNDNLKGIIWTEIITEKIRKQAALLDFAEKREQASMLKAYIAEIKYRDSTNREGHAAKVYFNALFGLDFTRSAECATNAALNYGYSLILSAFNREVVANGYLTQLGLFHDNMFNQFNLSSDLMEPFRCFVDRQVWENDFDVFEKEEKYEMISMLNKQTVVNNTRQTILNAIKIYTRSVFDALNEGDSSLILFPQL